MISDFHFLRPWWLAAIVLPVIIVWLASRTTDIRRHWKGMIAPHLLDNLLIEPDQQRHLRPVWLLALVLALMAVGLAGPTWKREASPFAADTAALVIAVDLSRSMDATDISPSRIERAKLKIHDILAMRQGARTAVIAYAGSAHLVVPLTDDDALIETYTDALATGIMPKPGKDTPAALLLADSLLKTDGSSGTILLLTDGVEDAAITAAKSIESDILILGFGTAAGGSLNPARGNPAAMSDGHETASGLDTDALQKTATAMDADVATMTDGDTDIRWIARNIQANFVRQSSKDSDRWHDLGWWFLMPAALLFALSFRRGWVVKLMATMVAIHLLTPIEASAGEFADMWLTPDQQGRLAFEHGDFETAAKLFKDPPWKGIALYRAGHFDQAYDTFAASDTPESRYNQGNCLMHMGKFDEAVDAYRRALAARKDWPEAEANLAIAERLKKQQEDDDQAQEPNEKPDSIQFDDKGKRGKAGTVNLAEQTAEMWIRNIPISPADLMARRFALETKGARP